MLPVMRRCPFRDCSSDPMELHDLRPLTWRDRLLWRRLGRFLTAAVLWVVIVLWLLSQLYEPGLYTVVVVATLGLALSSADMRQDRSDIPRWPRRTG